MIKFVLCNKVDDIGLPGQTDSARWNEVERAEKSFRKNLHRGANTLTLESIKKFDLDIETEIEWDTWLQSGIPIYRFKCLTVRLIDGWAYRIAAIPVESTRVGRAEFEYLSTQNLTKCMHRWNECLRPTW